MVTCSRCHKRMAVIFLTKMEGGETKQEGLCIKCAKELGIKPVEDVLSKIGLDDDAIDKLDSEMEDFIENAKENGILNEDGEPEEGDGLSEGRAPFLNLQNGPHARHGQGRLRPVPEMRWCMEILRCHQDAAYRIGLLR